MRITLLALLATMTTLPLAAQEKPKEVPPTVERTPYKIMINGEDMTPRFGPMMQRRARLGVSVSLEERGSDSLGAYIQSVTWPGGPAAKAGIKSGDIITRLDGKSVLPEAGSKRAQGESAPGVRLVELAAKLEPNDTIPVELFRDGARKAVTLVTGDEPMLAMEDPQGRAFVWRTPGGEKRECRMPGMTLERIPEGGRIEIRRSPGAMVFTSGPLGDLELAPLNPDLVTYFGTAEGILVIKAPADSPLQAAAAQQQAAASQQQAAAAQQQAAAAQQQAPAAGSPLPLGTVVPSLPGGCTATPSGGVNYYYCGGNFYQAVYEGSTLKYVTTKPK